MKNKKPYSKCITTAIIALAYLFIIFACYEMHRLSDLSPIAYIGAGIVALLAITVRAYMKRAVQEDLTKIKLEQVEGMSKLKKEYGDDFVNEDLADIDLDGKSY